jgi:ankyrin repeat protein
MRDVLHLSLFAIGVRALTVSTTGVRPTQPTPAVVPSSYSLHDAASVGDVGAVELLLAAGLSGDTRNDRSSTPLHLACVFGHDDVAAVLLGRGASANAQNEEGNTPLHAAVGAGQLPCV